MQRDQERAEPRLGLAHGLGDVVGAIELGAEGAHAALGAVAVELVDVGREREADVGSAPRP